MAHFAQLDDNDVVIRVLVIEPDEIDTGNWGDPASWVQTSYNTRGGIYYDPDLNEPTADQSKAFRKNYAGIGMVYDRARDAFRDPQPYPSWTLDESTCQWLPPVPVPDGDSEYIWDEDTLSWMITGGQD